MAAKNISIYFKSDGKYYISKMGICIFLKWMVASHLDATEILFIDTVCSQYYMFFNFLRH